MSDAAANLMIGGAGRRRVLRGLAHQHQHVQHRAGPIAGGRNGDPGEPHGRHGAVDGLSGGERGGPGLRTRDRPARGAGSTGGRATAVGDHLRGATGRPRCAPRLHAGRIALPDPPGLWRSRSVIRLRPCRSNSIPTSRRTFPGRTEGFQVVPRCRSRRTHDSGGRGSFRHRQRAPRGPGAHRGGVDRGEDRLWRKHSAVGAGAGRHGLVDAVGDVAVLHHPYSRHGVHLPGDDRGGRKLASRNC